MAEPLEARSAPTTGAWTQRTYALADEEPTSSADLAPRITLGAGAVLAVALTSWFAFGGAQKAAAPAAAAPVIASAGPLTMPGGYHPVAPGDEAPVDRLYRGAEELVPLVQESAAPRMVEAQATGLAAPEEPAAVPQREGPRPAPGFRVLPSFSGFPTIGGRAEPRQEATEAGSASAAAPGFPLRAVAAVADGDCPGCDNGAESRKFDPTAVTGTGTPIPEGMLFFSGVCDGRHVYGVRNNRGVKINLTMTSDSGEVWNINELPPGEVNYIKASKPIKAMNAGIVAIRPKLDPTAFR